MAFYNEIRTNKNVEILNTFGGGPNDNFVSADVKTWFIKESTGDLQTMTTKHPYLSTLITFDDKKNGILITD